MIVFFLLNVCSNSVDLVSSVKKIAHKNNTYKIIGIEYF